MKTATMFSVLVLAISTTFATSAMAFDFPDFPDFDMNRNFEASVITKSTSVKQYTTNLGARSYNVRLINGALTVVTNNGCAFTAKVIYAQWPKIQSVQLGQAVCK